MNRITSSQPSVNPYTNLGKDEWQIWEILMRHDFEAFAVGDWSMIQSDFWSEGFSGIDANKSPEPLNWHLAFPSLASYRDEWLRQAGEIKAQKLSSRQILGFLYNSAVLDGIEVRGNRAIGRKKFDGQMTTPDGRSIIVRFQSVYKLIRRDGNWLIEGFIGYLPNPMPRGQGTSIAEMPW